MVYFHRDCKDNRRRLTFSGNQNFGIHRLTGKGLRCKRIFQLKLTYTGAGKFGEICSAAYSCTKIAGQRTDIGPFAAYHAKVNFGQGIYGSAQIRK